MYKSVKYRVCTCIHILCDQNDVNFVITLPKGTSYMYIQIFNRVFSWNFYLCHIIIKHKQIEVQSLIMKNKLWNFISE